VNAKEMKAAGNKAMRHAARALGLDTGFAATCRDGFAGYGWYAWPKSDAAGGAIFLPEVQPLPRHFMSDDGAATEITSLERKRIDA
jgi:hypothetical protein